MATQSKGCVVFKRLGFGTFFFFRPRRKRRQYLYIKVRFLGAGGHALRVDNGKGTLVFIPAEVIVFPAPDILSDLKKLQGLQVY